MEENIIEEQQLTKKEHKQLRQQEKMLGQQKLLRKKKLRRLGIWSFTILGIAVMIFGIVKLSSRGTSSTNTTASIVDTVIETDRVKGNRESTITLIEYSDFQCPACQSYYPLLKQLSEEFQDNIHFVYRHFPLRQIHRNAEIAARASEAAGKQGKFWEMHDILFEKQKKWSNQKKAEDTFVEYAKSLNLNIGQFKNDIDSGEIKRKVEADYRTGVQAGVNATPTFFLNGEKIQNPRNYDEFRNIISQTLRQISG